MLSRSSRLGATASVVVGGLLLSACGGSGSGSGSSASQSGAGGSAGGNGGTVSITDAQDRTVKVPKNPKKVVVLDWSAARSLHALDAEIVGLPKPNGDLPSDLKAASDKATAVGTLFEPDYEGISKLNPDLVVVGARSGNKKVVDELTKITPNVIDMSTSRDPKTVIKSVGERYTQLASIFGKEADAKTTLATMNTNIADLRKKASAESGKTMFASVSGGKVSVFGAGSRFGRVWTDFGFKPVDAKLNEKGQHGEEINQEFFVKYNPAHLLVLDRGRAVGDAGKPALDVLNNGLVGKTDAAKNKKIALVDGFAWYLAPDSPVSVEQMVKDAQKAL